MSYADAYFNRFNNLGVVVSLKEPAKNTGMARGDTYVRIANLEGSAFADEITGNFGANILKGGAEGDQISGLYGKDRLFGGAGNDTLYGGYHNDALYGGDGDDLLYGGPGSDWLFGNDGNDVMNAGIGKSPDIYGGGRGQDMVDYSAKKKGVVVNLADSSKNGGAAKGDILRSIEDLQGTYFSDDLSGDHRKNRLDGRSGNDILNGGGGRDYLLGGQGDDLLYGGAGNDFLLAGYGNDSLFGGDGNDKLYASNGHNKSHILNGGAGNDLLVGARGNDIFNGGAGADKFEFKGRAGTDTIEDFTDGEDKILIRYGRPDQFSDLQIRQAGADTTITYYGTVIVLENFIAANLDASDFNFITY